MRRRNILIISAVVLAVAAAAAVFFLRRGGPPRAARLLPAADGYLYVDLKPLRAAGLFKNVVNPDPDYAQFVRDTGFQFERDLDEMALAIHLPPALNVVTSKAPPETRYSEVFVGRFDQAKLTAYLQKTAASSRPYRDTTIYAIPLPGRTLRVAMLSQDTVASSNADAESMIVSIIDAYRHTLPPSGPDLLRRYYRDVPFASVAWGVVRPATAERETNSAMVLPGGYDFFLPPGTVIVAAVRYLGSVQFRAGVFTRTPEQARLVSDQLNAFVALARTIELHAGAVDPEIKSFFESITVKQVQDHAELNATIPPGFMKQIVSEAPSLDVTPAQQPEKATPRPQRHSGKKKK